MITEKQLIEAQKQKLNTHIVMRFYFKVNNLKLSNPEKLQHQIQLVINQLVKKHDIKSESVELKFGTIDDDFVFNRCRLRISFNCI